MQSSHHPFRVCFANFQEKRKIFGNCHLLKNYPIAIRITEDLTTDQRQHRPAVHQVNNSEKARGNQVRIWQLRLYVNGPAFEPHKMVAPLSSEPEPVSTTVAVTTPVVPSPVPVVPQDTTWDWDSIPILLPILSTTNFSYRFTFVELTHVEGRRRNSFLFLIKFSLYNKNFKKQGRCQNVKSFNL